MINKKLNGIQNGSKSENVRSDWGQEGFERKWDKIKQSKKNWIQKDKM